MKVLASKYSFAHRVDPEADGRYFILGVPDEAETWNDDEEGAIHLLVAPTGDTQQVHGPEVEWDEMLGLNWEVDMVFPGVRACIV